MSFGHGTLAKLWANGYDLTAYLQNVASAATVTAEDATTLGKTAKVALPGLADATLNLDGLFDGGANAVDQVLAAALRAAGGTIFTWLPQGDGFGNAGYGLLSDETGYNVATPATGLAKSTATAQSRTGRERGLVAHALAQRTTTGNGSTLDNGAASAAGAVGYLQIIAVTGTGGTVKLCHSTDNVTYVDLITFAASTAVEAQRVEVSGSVYRYVRAEWTINTSSSLTFQALFCRK